MNRGIYASASGMAADVRWLEVLSNNLANASTTGFKREGIAFREALEREMVADFGQGPPIGSVGAGPTDAGRFTIFEKGNLVASENPLDVAIDADEGLFAVETPNGVFFTRAGSFELDLDRNLVTREGHKVLDPDGNPIQLPPGADVNIEIDGTVAVGDQVAGQIGVYRGAFERIGDGLFQGANVEAIDEPRLKPNAIETSNTEPVATMVELINLTRHFEMNQKSIQTQDEMTQRLIQSLSE